MTTPAVKKSKLGGRIVLAMGLVLAAVLAVVVVTGANQGGDESTPAERLCSLLKSGWSVDQLAANDVWQSWPDEESPMQRGMEIASVANAECPALI